MRMYLPTYLSSSNLGAENLSIKLTLARSRSRQAYALDVRFRRGCSVCVEKSGCTVHVEKGGVGVYLL